MRLRNRQPRRTWAMVAVVVLALATPGCIEASTRAPGGDTAPAIAHAELVSASSSASPDAKDGQPGAEASNTFTVRFERMINMTSYNVEVVTPTYWFRFTQWFGTSPVEHPDNATPVWISATFRWQAQTPLAETLQVAAESPGSNNTFRTSGTSPLLLEFDASSHHNVTGFQAAVGSSVALAYEQEVLVSGIVQYRFDETE